MLQNQTRHQENGNLPDILSLVNIGIKIQKIFLAIK